MLPDKLKEAEEVKTHRDSQTVRQLLSSLLESMMFCCRKSFVLAYGPTVAKIQRFFTFQQYNYLRWDLECLAFFSSSMDEK
jgi:hypothetical protein